MVVVLRAVLSAGAAPVEPRRVTIHAGVSQPTARGLGLERRPAGPRCREPAGCVSVEEA